MGVHLKLACRYYGVLYITQNDSGTQPVCQSRSANWVCQLDLGLMSQLRCEMKSEKLKIQHHHFIEIISQYESQIDSSYLVSGKLKMKNEKCVS
jgi:hypothetical protein